MKSLNVAVIGNDRTYAHWLMREDLVETLNIIDDHDYINGYPVDLVIFSGGSDISPSIYNDTTHRTTYPDANRDIRELKAYYKAAEEDTPMLGICRGAQFLTAMQDKGFVIQNITGHQTNSGFHTIIDTDSGKEYAATSSHHQMMYPFNVRGHKVISYSSVNFSKIYEVGHKRFEEFSTKMQTEYKEPEIVFYERTKALCIQGHPEWVPGYHEYAKYCRKLVKDYLLCQR